MSRCSGCGGTNHNRRTCPSSTTEQPTTRRNEDGTISRIRVVKKPADQRIVVIQNSSRSIHEYVENALREDAPASWKIVSVNGVAEGCALAISMNARHVVFCESQYGSKSGLRQWTDRLRNAIPDVQVLAIYEANHTGKVDEDIENAGFDFWVHPRAEELKAHLTKQISRWEPEDDWRTGALHNWSPWQAPSREKWVS